jgi:hypothetical protein
MTGSDSAAGADPPNAQVVAGAASFRTGFLGTGSMVSVTG